MNEDLCSASKVTYKQYLLFRTILFTATGAMTDYLRSQRVNNSR